MARWWWSYSVRDLDLRTKTATLVRSKGKVTQYTGVRRLTFYWYYVATVDAQLDAQRVTGAAERALDNAYVKALEAEREAQIWYSAPCLPEAKIHKAP